MWFGFGGGVKGNGCGFRMETAVGCRSCRVEGSVRDKINSCIDGVDVETQNPIWEGRSRTRDLFIFFHERFFLLLGGVQKKKDRVMMSMLVLCCLFVFAVCLSECAVSFCPFVFLNF